MQYLILPSITWWNYLYLQCCKWRNVQICWKLYGHGILELRFSKHAFLMFRCMCKLVQISRICKWRLLSLLNITVSFKSSWKSFIIILWKTRLPTFSLLQFNNNISKPISFLYNRVLNINNQIPNNSSFWCIVCI